ncbi:hypothetical protein HOP50_15g75340 [Chloropicon primus]|uniref:ARM repeat domain-containing protein n=1 Tax=Chloropicon primus TaxID=1764295 RepID=A0A5B8MXC3_9CHLO|nr:hypothetical protein A3770_15p75090 [Chloropicon primus]UPR04200.1 hypothetical protein HOP50_15g75340 [Chloropicon primus]|eukprot:QDZ24991.1 hypothetical protein A3770_15p75090 [Chloropicon primus]
MPKGKKGKKGGKKGKKGKKNARPAHMSEELWKHCNNIPDLLLNFQDKPSQTSSVHLSRSKAAFYLWQLALKGKKKRGELVQGGVLTSALSAIELSPKDEDTQVRAPTIGLISSLCVDDAARVTVMGVKNAAVVNQLMGNLSYCTPCTIASAARALAVLAKEETDSFLKAATSLDPIAKCLDEDNSLAARVEAASCLATCLKARLSKNPAFSPSLYNSLQKKRLLTLLSRLCQEAGLSSLHALAKEKAATCLFYMTQNDLEMKKTLEQMKGIEALACVLVDPYCALIGKAHAAGALYNLLTPDLKLGAASLGQGEALGIIPLSESMADLRTGEANLSTNNSLMFNESFNTSVRSLPPPGHLLPGNLREEVSQFEEIVFSGEQKQARQHTVEKLVKAELILPLLHLCCGPSGPPKAVDRAQSAPAPETKAKKGKKKKKKKGKKGKKVKPPAGMNDANFYGAGCLRHISHYENFKINIAELDGERYVIPLLNSKLPKVRWHARAILLNLATTPSSEIRMMQFGAPKHMVGLSKSRAQLDRPQTAPVSSRYYK